MSSIEATDADRFPTLGEPGRRMLRFLREHPHAPVYRNHSGNRLLAEDVAALRVQEKEVAQAQVGWVPGQPPAWLQAHIAHCYQQVPHYRALGSPPRRLQDVASIQRGALSADIARFVPDTVALARMINFRTTGTTGHPLVIPSHPRVAGSYLAFHRRALRRVGIELQHGRDQVGVVLLGFQRRCFTYVSVTPAMDESGLAKINLHPEDWRSPDDRARYLDALQPELIAGDPISFAELLRLPLQHRPRALLSVSMALSPALRAQLETRFACPVLDIYSLNEVGPVGVFDADAGGHVLLQPRLYVEILDDHDQPLPPGARGEITVSGGFNPCLPLLRYRTGDHGALHFDGPEPVIVDLAGRRPLRYRNAAGQWFNNIDISHALAPMPASRFCLHQHADGTLQLSLPATELGLAAQARTLLAPLFGTQTITVQPLHAEDKTLQYRSDLPGALA